jgi:hypothetical protein
MLIKTMYDYYVEADFQPTFANSKGDFNLKDYAAHRHDFFTSKLKLPNQLFKFSELLEFGPDTGENALVFAGMEANVTLCEPNPNCLPHIESYFDRYQLNSYLQNIYTNDVASFSIDKLYDFIVAEGFIYTVQPTESWIAKFASLLKDDGFIIISYYDDCGSFVELFHKLLLHYATISSSKNKNLAEELFREKWNSINHTRSFDSWSKDVLLNPFVRYKYFLHLPLLLKSFHKQGLQTYSSWPNYQDSTRIYWHKAPVTREQELSYQIEHIKRSSLSYVLGKKAYMFGDMAEVTKVNEFLANIFSFADSKLDQNSNLVFSDMRKIIGELLDVLRSSSSISNIDNIITFYETLEIILQHMEENNFDELINICNSNPIFLNTWGMANQYVVLKKGVAHG